MGDNKAYIKLVRQARQGSRKSLEKLAAEVRGRLYAYVYRIVLRDDLAQDIVQETMLEMFKIFGKLEREDRFWPWLRGIAFNKIRRHYTKQQRHRTVPMSSIPEPQVRQASSESGFANLVTEELKQVVVASMQKIRPQYRKVLTMRCYEEMEYAEIAELMGCSELSARVTFCRAKKSLQRHLSRNGLAKGSFVTALVIFGKITAPSEAVAANISVTAASMNVGLTAGILGMVGAKTAVLSVTAASMLAVGGVVVTSGIGDKSGAVLLDKPETKLAVTAPAQPVSNGTEEYWYYYPKQAGGPVMMRQVAADSKGRQPYCRRLQNEQANYFFDSGTNTILIENARIRRPDLSVWRLPADSPQMRQFLTQVEGGRDDTEYTSVNGDGLLVIVKSDADGGGVSQIARHRNVLDEEFFVYGWHEGVGVVDNRDPMHKRGWTYFTVSGEMNGRRVSGSGRLPFVYGAGTEYGPWLKLRVTGGLRVADDGAEACVYGADDELLLRCEGGSFFVGLSRPWMGLHTIDTVRRDAARDSVRFETSHAGAGDRAEVTLNSAGAKIVYTVDLQTDVIEKIVLSTSDGKAGELRFSYMQDVNEQFSGFSRPRNIGTFRVQKRQSPGVLWPINLLEGALAGK